MPIKISENGFELVTNDTILKADIAYLSVLTCCNRSSVFGLRVRISYIVKPMRSNITVISVEWLSENDFMFFGDFYAFLYIKCTVKYKKRNRCN